MNEHIYNTIKTNNGKTFGQLFKKIITILPNITKQEVGNTLQELETQHHIITYNHKFYDLTQFPNIEGFAQFNLSGFSWLSNTDTSNQYGISFNPNTELLPIFNKRNLGLAHYCHGKLINIDDKEFIYVLNSKPTKDINLFVVFDQQEGQFVSLNSHNFIIEQTAISLHEQSINHNDIIEVLFNSQSNTYSYLNYIGNINDMGIETNLILKLGDIKHCDLPLSQPIVDHSSQTITLDKPFYTIDSISTKDIDDAIWVEFQSGIYTLYVAIADVSEYIPKNTPLDLHAQQVGTSFYLPHKTIHMLSRDIAEQHCSLNIGQPKKALVATITLNEQGQVLNSQFSTETILIKSKLTYKDIDNLITLEQKPVESFIYHNGVVEPYSKNNLIETSLNHLQDILKLTSIPERDKDYWFLPSIQYELNSSGKIDNLYLDNHDSTSQQMVASAMLLANKEAAKFIFDKYQNCGLFRNQNVKPDFALPQPAYYLNDNYGHWGLQTEFYTHFTSPIRRYCDLTVHRLIKDAIHNTHSYSQEELTTISHNINLQQYKSKQYSIKAKNLLLSQYIEQQTTQNTLNQQWHIIDIAEDGISFRNEQLIDTYVPSFKIPYDFFQQVKEFLKSHDNNDFNSKIQFIDTLNQSFNFNIQYDKYQWATGKKQVQLHINTIPKISLAV